MQTSQGSPFEPWRRTTPPARAEQDDHGFSTLRAAVTRSRRRFVLVNAVGWAAAIGVPPLTGIPLGAAVVGDIPLCMVLLAACGCLLLATSERFDREARQAYRAWWHGQVASRGTSTEGR